MCQKLHGNRREIFPLPSSLRGFPLSRTDPEDKRLIRAYCLIGHIIRIPKKQVSKSRQCYEQIIAIYLFLLVVLEGTRIYSDDEDSVSS